MVQSGKQKPSVIAFEQAVAEKQYSKALEELLSILEKFNSNNGRTIDIECNYPSQIKDMQQEKVVHFCTRMVQGITTLFLDPKLEIPWNTVIALLSQQRWINMIFASSPYVNTDHILKAYAQNHSGDKQGKISITGDRNACAKFFILLIPESNLKPNLDEVWRNDPALCASLCFAWLSPKFMGTPAAFNKRKHLLQWFPKHLEQIQTLNGLPGNIAHDLYMHCSYDSSPNKHDIKRSLNHVIRRHILQQGWQDRDISEIGTVNGKPVMVVLLEHFNAGHSIYRTHSTSMMAARTHFHLIGFGNAGIDEAGRKVFDEFHQLKASCLENMQQIRETCEKHKAAVLYMPSIGMDLNTIFVSNARFAPIQAVALGHPATTHSDFIEYVIVEDDYIGDEKCFSEKLLRLPKDALPYVPNAKAPESVEYILRENPETVQIGIAATTMKLNPHFLETLCAIRDNAKVKVYFHFALGNSIGIIHPYVTRVIKSYLGDSAITYPVRPYAEYMETLRQCDMLLNPFPFGNTNGIIDMVTLGLVGVCKTGPEVHEHIDGALFRRLGLPEWLIAETTDEYISRAIRLIENHQERVAIRRRIIKENSLKKLFTGDPCPMGRVFLEKLNEWLKEADKAKASKKSHIFEQKTNDSQIDRGFRKPFPGQILMQDIRD